MPGYDARAKAGRDVFEHKEDDLGWTIRITSRVAWKSRNAIKTLFAGKLRMKLEQLVFELTARGLPSRDFKFRAQIRDSSSSVVANTNPWNPWNPVHRMTSFCPVDSTIIVVGIEPAALVPSFASAAPSTVTLSPTLTVSFFHPPRTSA